MDVSKQFTDNANVAIAHLIDKVLSGIDQTADFLGSQLPDVIHQLLVYNLVASSVMFAVQTCIMVASLVFGWICYRNYKKIGDFIVPAVIVPVALDAVILCHLNLQWLKIWLAPKIWLIEYAAKLAKTASGH